MSNKIGLNACVVGHSLSLSQHIDVDPFYKRPSETPGCPLGALRESESPPGELSLSMVGLMAAKRRSFK